MVAGCGGAGVCVACVLVWVLVVASCASVSSVKVVCSSGDKVGLTSSMSVSSRASHAARGWSSIGSSNVMRKMVVSRRSGEHIESASSRSLTISAS